MKLSPELRPALYASILPLLSSDEDMAVRLTASKTLKMAIDDFEFNTDQFLPFLEPSFSLLFALLKEATDCDTKVILTRDDGERDYSYAAARLFKLVETGYPYCF